MKLLAVRIHIADINEPKTTSQMNVTCNFLLIFLLSHVNIHKPRKVDSIKKANKASIANGAPKISPTKRE